jgi:hypothetical protein
MLLALLTLTTVSPIPTSQYVDSITCLSKRGLITEVKLSASQVDMILDQADSDAETEVQTEICTDLGHASLHEGIES